MASVSSIPSTALPKAASLNRIPSLDGLRALSIFLVIALHTLQRYSITHPLAWYWYGIFNGESGVFIFFEISGFLITSLLLEEHRKRGSISLRGFYLRRAFRILPPLYLYIGIVFLLGLAGRLAYTRIDILSSLFFFHNIKASGPSVWRSSFTSYGPSCSSTAFAVRDWPVAPLLQSSLSASSWFRPSFVF